jgi:alpha,alpha-trehalose phosphorylase (configuration-retaining)
MGICIPDTDTLYIAVGDKKQINVYPIKLGSSSSVQQTILSWLYKYHRDRYEKIISVEILNNNTSVTEKNLKDFAARLWLRQDITPFIQSGEIKGGPKKCAISLAEKSMSRFVKNDIVDIRFDTKTGVHVSELARLEDYKKLIGKESFLKLTDYAMKLKTKNERIAFFSSTPRGGGVALMRHALIRLFRLLGVDAYWYVMRTDKEVFKVTKEKFHNVLQGVSVKGQVITEKDKKIYEEWIQTNVEQFTHRFKEATTIIIDDPQPSGMIPHIKKIHPNAHIIYRSHIQVESDLIAKKNTPQQKTWEFLWNNIKHADLFVSHPVPKFIPHNVPADKIVVMPATTDEFDGLNKPLKKSEVEHYLELLNEYLLKHKQTPLDLGRPYITQIARFDPAKGIPDVIVAYQRLCQRLKREGVKEKKIPQLVIAGHSSVDDPEGSKVFKETINKLTLDIGKPCARDIKVATLHNNDQILNAILRACTVALQLSHREGFEVKVTEALAKGKPVVAYKAGGIPLQIQHGVTGYLVTVGDTKKVTDYLYKLTTDDELYRTMSKQATEKMHKNFFTASNAVRWMEMILENPNLQK